MLRSALTIDDDPLFLIVAEETLAMYGIEVIEAIDDGRAGIQRLREQAFDLVLCDLQMPGLDGISLIRELGEMDFQGQLVIVSSEPPEILDTVYRMAQLSGLRVMGFVRKPLSLAKLSKVLSKRVDYSGSADEKLTRQELISAIDSGIIVPHYQPKFDLAQTKISSAEALARIDMGDGQISSAWPYLEAAELLDCTHPFTLAIFKRILTDISTMSWDCMNIAVNVSPRALDATLPDEMRALCEQAGVKPKSITVEITENALLDYTADTLQTLSRFRLMGFRLSLDDFGTGSTSIEQLRLYPFNELKIDKSFVQDADTDVFSKVTLESSSKLAAMSGMEVVAEGIETKNQLDMVFKAGARYAQGYFIAKPMSAERFNLLIDNMKPEHTNVA